MNTEMYFNEKAKHGEVFASGYCGSFKEYYSNEDISDKEIDKASKKVGYVHRDNIIAFQTGAKWYREQLKKRQ